MIEARKKKIRAGETRVDGGRVLVVSRKTSLTPKTKESENRNGISTDRTVKRGESKKGASQGERNAYDEMLHGVMPNTTQGHGLGPSTVSERGTLTTTSSHLPCCALLLYSIALNMLVTAVISSVRLATVDGGTRLRPSPRDYLSHEKEDWNTNAKY